ncbi:MAG: addiction module protein [Planctomycetota bacterium]|nr:addiction module protein [Planctomycetota bacterium]
MTKNQVVKLALELPKHQQDDLLVELIEAFRTPPAKSTEEIEAAWEKEIRKRIKDVEDGRVELVSGEEVRRKLRRKNR